MPRVVQESVAMVYRDAGDRWIAEGAPVDDYPIAAGNHVPPRGQCLPIRCLRR